MNTRFVILESQRGFFIGEWSGIAVFTDQELFEIVKIYTFETEEVARQYVEQFLPSIKDTVTYEPVTCKHNYATVVELVKSGLTGPHVDQLFSNTPTFNQTVN